MQWLLLIIVLVIIGALIWWWWRSRSNASTPTSTGAGAAAGAEPVSEVAPFAGTSDVAAADDEAPTSDAAVDAGDVAPAEADDHGSVDSAATVDVGEGNEVADDASTDTAVSDAATSDVDESSWSQEAAADDPVLRADAVDDQVDSDEGADVADDEATADDAATEARGFATTVAATDGAFGPGSADPADDGSGPAGYDIKGNADSMLYHTTDSPYYGRTKAEVWFDTESSADAAGFTRWDQRDRNAGGSGDEGEPVADNESTPQGFASVAAVPDGAFGPGSADPADDGSGPAGYDIKGNADSMLYHTTESPYYGRTKAEAWFDTESSAETAGFTRWDRKDDGGDDDDGSGAQAFAAVEVPDGAFGPGSADPADDGSGPAGYDIKGNADSMLYHTTESAFYSVTKAEVWFKTEEAARNAGFRSFND